MSAARALCDRLVDVAEIAYVNETGAALIDTEASAVIVLRKADRGAMASGGTVTFEVYAGGRWIGWVYDTRRFTGSGFAGRRWWATWREDGDTAARWTTEGHRTRQAAVDALVARVEVG